MDEKGILRTLFIELIGAIGEVSAGNDANKKAAPLVAELETKAKDKEEESSRYSKYWLEESSKVRKLEEELKKLKEEKNNG